MMRKTAMLRKTSVLWDIISCPIPAGFDPCLVGRRIETALKKSGHSDPVTITAIGNLREGVGPGEDVLRKLSSSGIALNHSIRVHNLGMKFYSNKSYPATTMFIFGGRQHLERLTFFTPAEEGYRILLAYNNQRDPSLKNSLNNVSKEWLWKSLLSDDDDMEDSGSADKTTRLVLQDKYTETGESPWFCDECHFAGKSFEDFSTHLKSGEHGFSEWDSWASKNKVYRDNPDNFVWGRSEEWDLINLEDMAGLGYAEFNQFLETTVVVTPSEEKCNKKLKGRLTVN